MELKDRYQGCLLGLATGDALGTTLEFKSPGTFEPIHDMVGGGPFGLEPGQWTDDTSMALCLAESLISCGRFPGPILISRHRAHTGLWWAIRIPARLFQRGFRPTLWGSFLQRSSSMRRTCT